MTASVYTVVAGLSGAAADADVLDRAIEEAALHCGRVRAVHAWLSPLDWQSEPVFAPDEGSLRAAAHERLDRAVGARVVDARVEVSAELVEGEPGPALVDAARGADVLVVGSHGHGRFVGSLLGSVSRYCVRHADVPVIVVEHAH